MTRAEYVAPARQRRAQALEMREKGIAAREIARVLSISVREVYRLLRSVVTAVVRFVGSAPAPTVQGPPALSDFKGTYGPPLLSLGVVGIGEVNSVATTENDDVVISEPSTAHGGASAAAIVSEYAVPARSAEPQSDVTGDGRGVWGKPTPARVRSRIFSVAFARWLQNNVNRSGHHRPTRAIRLRSR